MVEVLFLAMPSLSLGSGCTEEVEWRGGVQLKHTKGFTSSIYSVYSNGSSVIIIYISYYNNIVHLATPSLPSLPPSSLHPSFPPPHVFSLHSPLASIMSLEDFSPKPSLVRLLPR